MKKSIVATVALIFLLSGTGVLLSHHGQGDPKFAKALDAFLDAYWKFYPTAGTLAGYNKYNEKLEDFSESNLEKRQNELDNFNKQFITQIDKNKLTPEQQADLAMVIDSIDLELLRHERLVPWEYNPLFYNEVIVNSLQSLLTKNFAPLDARMKSAMERVKALPNLIKQAKENLKTPAQIYTETAIKQFVGILDFYKNEIPKLIESAPADLKNKFQTEYNKAVAALEDYQRYLKNELLPKSSGNFRLGEVHARLLQLTALVNIPFESISAQAKADSANIRRRMVFPSMALFEVLNPQLTLEEVTAKMGEDKARNYFITSVLDKLKTDHGTKEEFVNQVKAAADRVKSFLQQSQIINLPQETPAYEAMPSYMKSGLLVRLLSPGPYETSGDYKVMISTLPEDLTPEQSQSLLEEFNNYYLPFWTARWVYPGSFIPTVSTFKGTSSIIMKMFPNQPLMMGWSLYVADMFVHHGFNNYDVKSRMFQLKQQLQAVIDYQIDLNVHQSSLSKEEAVRIMTQSGFMSQVEAERKWNQILLNPGQAAYAYIGLQELLEMEKEYKTLKGASFSKNEFLQKVLSYGPISFRQLKLKMAK